MTPYAGVFTQRAGWGTTQAACGRVAGLPMVVVSFQSQCGRNPLPLSQQSLPRDAPAAHRV